MPPIPTNSPVMMPKSYLEVLLSPPPAVPIRFRPDSVTIREELSGSMQEANAESVQVQSPARECYMFTLPEDILGDILLWTRPDDQDQSIWLWLCRVSATCKVFRHLVRLEKKGVARLMPTVFELQENFYYLNEGIRDRSQFLFAPVSLRVKLMDTIRNSDWMGCHIRSFRAFNEIGIEDERGHLSMTVLMALKNLLIAPCLPNLLDLTIQLETPCTLVDERFLRGLARMHSGLKNLFLLDSGHNPPQHEVSPELFATLSASMHCLKEAGIGVSEYGTNQFPDQHLSEFIANLNPRLTCLVLDFDERSEYPTDEGFSNLSVCCPDLKSLDITSKTITTSRIAEIIRSKRNLVSIYLKDCDHDTIDDGVVDAIIETQLRLETFQVHYCNWFNDSSLMRLLESQIDTFNGQVPLTRIGIFGTSVTPAGVRTFLTRWKETNPLLPMTIESLYEYDDDEQVYVDWQRLIVDFPEVEITMDIYYYHDGW